MKRTVAMLLLTTVVLGALACGGGALPRITPQDATSAALTGAAAEVQTSMRNLQKLKSYRIAITADLNDSRLDSVLEIESPDRLHLVLGGGGALTDAEQIAIGATSYTKQGGRWVKDPSGGIAFDPKELATSLQSLVSSARVTKANMDVVNGKRCQVYQIDDPKTQSSNQLCIADRLPLRLTTTGSTIFGNATIVFSNFGARFGIKAPV